MKKKILIGIIFAALLMLSLPVVSNIQAQSTRATVTSMKSEMGILEKYECTLVALIYKYEEFEENSIDYASFNVKLGILIDNCEETPSLMINVRYYLLMREYINYLGPLKSILIMSI